MGPAASQTVSNVFIRSGFSLPIHPTELIEITLPNQFLHPQVLSRLFIVWSLQKPGEEWKRVSQGWFVKVFSSIL